MHRWIVFPVTDPISRTTPMLISRDKVELLLLQAAHNLEVVKLRITTTIDIRTFVFFLLISIARRSFCLGRFSVKLQNHAPVFKNILCKTFDQSITTWAFAWKLRKTWRAYEFDFDWGRYGCFFFPPLNFVIQFLCELVK